MPHHRNTAERSRQYVLHPLNHTSCIGMWSNEKHLDGPQDSELKEQLYTQSHDYLRRWRSESKVDKSQVQESKNIQLRITTHTVWDPKTEFSKEVEILQKTQTKGMM